VIVTAQVTPCAARILAEAGLTDPGLVRAANEDALVRRPKAGLWAVADGMGGHAEGAWASATIAQALEAVELTGDFDEDLVRTAAAIDTANAQIWRRGEGLGGRIGSTVAAVLVGERRYGVLWAGDSRAYRLRAGNLERLTTDHSEEAPTEGAAKSGDDSTPERTETNTPVTRAVGGSEALELDLRVERSETADRYLLCSDGLTRALNDQALSEVLTVEKDPELCGRRLLLAASEAAADDNVTAVVIDA